MSSKNSHNDNHEHEHEFELDDTIILIDEDENEHTFTLVDYLEIEEQVYAVLLPEDNPEDGAFVFRVELDEDGEEILMDIEDDQEFERVIEILESADQD